MKRLLQPHNLIPIIIGVPLGLAIFYMYRLWMVPVPIEVFQRHAEPYEVTTGTRVLVSWQEVRTDECYSMIYRQLISSDGTVITFEPMLSEKKPVGETSGGFKFIIPGFIASGPLTYRVKTQFFCNWVQEILGGPWLPLQDIKFNYTTSVVKGIQ